MRHLTYTGILFFCTTTIQAATPAIGGTCPVTLYETGKVVPGAKEHQTIFDHRTWIFAGEKQKQMFEGNPTRYVPVLGGDCVVSWETLRARIPGKPSFFVKHQGLLYLFPDQKQKNTFAANPKNFALSDLPLTVYCPVTLLEQHRLVQGKAEHTSVYDGLRYLFPTAGLKAKFDANPTKYAPVLSGNCVVCLKVSDKPVKGKIEFGLFHKGRSYLLPSEEARRRFFENPKRFEDADLAAEGNCVVLQKIAGKQVAGSKDFQAIHHGLLYRFPTKSQLEMFERDPSAFALYSPLDASKSEAPARLTPMPIPDRGKLTKVPVPSVGPSPSDLVSIIGKTACAGCDFGKRPLTDTDSLGLAVVTTDKVYIVDRAEKLYSKIFENRFEELRVQVKGRVKKQSGKFIWVDPTSVLQVE